MKEITKSIGWAIVRVRNWSGHTGLRSAQWDMHLMTPASGDEPAMSVEVSGGDNIRELRDALNEALEETTP